MKLMKSVLLLALLALIAFACVSCQEEVSEELDLNGAFEADDGLLLYVTHVNNLVYIVGSYPPQTAMDEEIDRSEWLHTFQGFVALEEGAEGDNETALITGSWAFIPGFLDSNDQLESWKDDIGNKWGILTLRVVDEDNLEVISRTGTYRLESGSTLSRLSVEEAFEKMEREFEETEAEEIEEVDAE